MVGVLVASGVCASYLLCAFTLPDLLAMLDPRIRFGKRIQSGPVGLASWGQRRRLLVTAGLAALAVAATFGVSKNAISDSVLEYFPSSHRFHMDTSLVQSDFSGVNEILYSVESGGPDGILQHDFANGLRNFASYLRGQPEVTRVTSITDSSVIQKAIEDGRLEERPDRYRTQKEALALTRRPVPEVSESYSAALVAVYLRPLDSARITAFDERVRQWTSLRFSSASVTAGGASLLFAYLGQNNINGMLVALSVALLAAALVIGVVFRSATVALAAAICNAFPVVLVYAVWGLVIGKISLGAAIVMGMIVGIVIDDSVYLITYARRARSRGLASPVLAAVGRIGPALVITTIALAGGQSVGMLSDFQPIWSMSILSVAIIVAALLTDLLFLPVLLERPGETHNE